MKKKTKDYKKCPRCKEKLDLFAPICPNCNLKFNKLDLATNKAAKIAIKEKRKHHVIYVNKRPSDVKKGKFIISLIFGWLGMHNIYLGKYVKGWLAFSLFWSYITIFMTCAIMVDNKIITMQAFNIVNYFILSTMAFAFAGLLILWFDDILSVIMGKFKFPVSIPKEVQIDNLLHDDDTSTTTQVTEVVVETDTNENNSTPETVIEVETNENNENKN